MSQDVLLAIAAGFGCAGSGLWIYSISGDAQDGSSRRRSRFWAWTMATFWAVVLIGALGGPGFRIYAAYLAHEAVSDTGDVLALIPLAASVRYVGLLLLANGAALVAAALVMALTRFIIRITTPYAPARARAPDRFILLAVLLAGNAALAAIGGMYGATLFYA